MSIGAHARLCLVDVRPVRSAFSSGRDRRRIAPNERFERIAQHDRGVRRHAQQPLQFNQLPIDGTDLNQPIGFQPPPFDAQHVAIERRRGALLDARSDERALARRRGEELLGDLERPHGCHDIAVLQAHAGSERSFPVRGGMPGDVDLAAGNFDPPGLAEQVERPLQLHSRLVVAA